MKSASTHGAGLHIAVLQHEFETGLGRFSALMDKAGATCEVLATGGATPLPAAVRFDGVIALGGSLGADEPTLLGTRQWIRAAVLGGTPFLGICLGSQLLARALGGLVRRRSRPVARVHDIFLTAAGKEDPLFGGLPGSFSALGWHEDIFELPGGAIPLAGSIADEHEAFRFGTNAYGLQFHPEVTPDDLVRWTSVPSYAGFLERAGAEFPRVHAALQGAVPELDALAEHLLERWLHLVTGAGPMRAGRTLVAA
jgi:GMP synthase-like glutamine amidotransferase